MHRPPFVAVACLVVLLAPLIAQAQAPSFGARDKAWELETRELDLQSQTSGFTYTSVRNSTLGTDTWRLQFDAASASFVLDVNATRPQAAEVQLKARLRSLIEFQDLDGDGRLGLGDPVVQQFLFADGGGWIETLSHPDGSREPVAHYWLRGARVDINFHALANGTWGPSGSPTAMPFEVRIQSFPYATDNQTNLALEWRVQTPVVPSGHALATPNQPLRAYLAWTPPVDSAGNVSEFGVTLQQYLGQPAPQWLITLSEPREAAGTVQLVIGVARVTPEPTIQKILRDISGDWRFYVLGLLVAGLAVGWPLYRRLHTGGRA